MKKQFRKALKISGRWFEGVGVSLLSATLVLAYINHNMDWYIYSAGLFFLAVGAILEGSIFEAFEKD